MKDRYVYLGIICILLYMLPYFVLGENAYITIHDFIEQNVSIMANLKNNGLLMNLSGVVPNMDGLDRSLFPFFTPFDVKMVCYALLPTYWAVITYTLVYKIAAFAGMYLLLDTYLFKYECKLVTLMLSLGFAFVPFYVELALSGAGFPLVTYAFINLYYEKDKMWSYIAIAFYTFNSLLAYGGFFFLAILFCCLVLDYNRTKKIPKNVMLGALFMCFVYLLANWGIIYSLFFSEAFVSHRSEWVHSTTLANDLSVFIDTLLWSQYHAGKIVGAPVLLAYLIVYWKFRKKYPILNAIAILYVLIAIGIFVGMMLKLSHIQLFVTIQFDRFYFFYPSIVILLLSVVCYVVLHEKSAKWALALAIYGLGCGIVNDNEMKNNLRLIVNRPIQEPTFRQFYDTDLFAEICSEIGINQDYRSKVVSVGMYPSVAEYNGLYTLDAYRVNYPLEYKNSFRKVIAGELAKDETLHHYYDDWGSRCCILTSEIKKDGNKYLCSKNENLTVEHLDIDVDALKDLGCQYVLSAVDIKNHESLGLKMVGDYTTPESFWRIRVYKL